MLNDIKHINVHKMNNVIGIKVTLVILQIEFSMKRHQRGLLTCRH